MISYGAYNFGINYFLDYVIAQHSSLSNKGS